MEPQMPNVDFSVDPNNLYREETVTDMKVASIRVMTPIKLDGSDDSSKKAIYMGHTQLMSPDGPLPIQAPLEATNIVEAIAAFPDAMEAAFKEMFERIKEMHKKQAQEQQKSNIIMPGM